MRVSSLLLSLLISICAFLSTTPTQAIAINLRNNDKSSSAVRVLSSADQVHASAHATTIAKTDLSATPAPTTSNKVKQGLLDAHDKAKQLIKEYHEFPEWARYMTAIAGIVLGIMLALFGHQFIRTAVFVVCGFVCGSLVYGALEESLAANMENRIVIIYASSITAALVAGLFFLYCSKIGFMFIGACVGIMIAIVLEPVALRFVWPSQPLLNLYLWMAVFGIVTGVLSLCLEKLIFVLATAVVGSFIFMLSIAAMAGGLDMLATYKVDDPVPKEAWYYLVGFAVCVLVGVSVQFCYTANKKSDRAHKKYKDDK